MLVIALKIQKNVLKTFMVKISKKYVINIYVNKFRKIITMCVKKSKKIYNPMGSLTF